MSGHFRLRYYVPSALASSFLLILIVAGSAGAQGIPTPADHFGHEIGADRMLVVWDGLVEYMRMVGDRSDRVKVREMGQSTDGRPFLFLEISASGTIANIEESKALQQRLYFQDHRPGEDPNTAHSEAQRLELFRSHKAVVLITCSIHALALPEVREARQQP